ncbi:hypothetical protein, partial [Roseibium sp.]|uniref:hypothetical protein n=1 Tax=Roseibium sp. TaxID=1936156 RepID=UPI00329A0F53
MKTSNGFSPSKRENTAGRQKHIVNANKTAMTAPESQGLDGRQSDTAAHRPRICDKASVRGDEGNAGCKASAAPNLIAPQLAFGS